MLSRNSRQNLWVLVQAQLGTLSQQSWQYRDIGVSFFVVTLSRQLLMLLYQSVCHDKVVKCRDICAASMSLAFVASLSRQCSLTFFFDDCREKLFIIATNFHCLILCFIMTKFNWPYLIIVATNYSPS